MGHAAPTRSLPPASFTQEDYNLAIARGRFCRGDITVEEFEEQVGRVLCGERLNLRYGELPPIPELGKRERR